MKNGSENDHNLSCQNNTQKVVNMAPTLVQNGAQVGSQIDQKWVPRGTEHEGRKMGRKKSRKVVRWCATVRDPGVGGVP